MRYAAAAFLLGLAIAPAHAQIQPGPNLSPSGRPFLYAPRAGYLGPPIAVHRSPRFPIIYNRTGAPSIPIPDGPAPAPPLSYVPAPPPPPLPEPPPPLAAAPPPPGPPPLGWVFTRYTVCPEPRSCPVVFVSVDADGLNVRTVPDGPPIMALVNGTPLVVLDRQRSWTLVAPACDLTPTFLWTWNSGVPLNRCWVYP
jgi:hypothetical protein